MERLYYRLKFPKTYCRVFLFLSIDFVLANSADPDEMLHYMPYMYVD